MLGSLDRALKQWCCPRRLLRKCSREDGETDKADGGRPEKANHQENLVPSRTLSDPLGGPWRINYTSGVVPSRSKGPELRYSNRLWSLGGKMWTAGLYPVLQNNPSRRMPDAAPQKGKPVVIGGKHIKTGGGNLMKSGRRKGAQTWLAFLSVTPKSVISCNML